VEAGEKNESDEMKGSDYDTVETRVKE